MRNTIEDLERDVTEAHQTVVRTRALWADLLAAHRNLDRAQEAAIAAAAKVGVTSLPVDGITLADMRKAAEARAHEIFIDAREALTRQFERTR